MSLNHQELIAFQKMAEALAENIPGVDDPNPGGFKPDPRPIPEGLGVRYPNIPLGHIALQGDFTTS